MTSQFTKMTAFYLFVLFFSFITLVDVSVVIKNITNHPERIVAIIILEIIICLIFFVLLWSYHQRQIQKDEESSARLAVYLSTLKSQRNVNTEKKL